MKVEWVGDLDLQFEVQTADHTGDVDEVFISVTGSGVQAAFAIGEEDARRMACAILAGLPAFTVSEKPPEKGRKDD